MNITKREFLTGLVSAVAISATSAKIDTSDKADKYCEDFARRYVDCAYYMREGIMTTHYYVPGLIFIINKHFDECDLGTLKKHLITIDLPVKVRHLQFTIDKTIRENDILKKATLEIFKNELVSRVKKHFIDAGLYEMVNGRTLNRMKGEPNCVWTV